MDITEYLNRINLKSADTTLFKKEMKDVKLVKDGKETKESITGISTYTFFENGSAGVVGFLRYENDFPEQVFSIDPTILNKILELTDSIEIEDTFLVGKSKYGEIKRDLNLEKWRTLKIEYENEPLEISNEIIQRIIKTDNIIDSAYITMEGDGKNLIITLFPKMTNSEAKIVIPSKIKTSYKFNSFTFMEVLKILGTSNVKFYMDNIQHEERKNLPLKIELTDTNAQISYYITEVIVEVAENESNKKPVENSEKDSDDDFENEDNIDIKESVNEDDEF